jgi:D-alanine-D-alanine ligase-like ATP-grasp enzyme
VFPYAEIDFIGEYADNWNVYSYEAKWVDKSWEYWSSPVRSPVILARKVEAGIDKLVTRAFKVLDCCDVVRFDIRLDDLNKPYIIDVNVMPCLKRAEEEECWRSAKALGWSYEQLIETIVAVAYRRVYGRLPDRMRERQLLLNSPL